MGPGLNPGEWARAVILNSVPHPAPPTSISNEIHMTRWLGPRHSASVVTVLSLHQAVGRARIHRGAAS
jgi:hypothetical protein